MSVLVKAAFPPIVDCNATILILGSMPGEQSLLAGQYYANKRNAFWVIMEDLIGVSSELNYLQRIDKLKQAGIALWDVIEKCERAGSLDTAIVEETVIANDFTNFLQRYKKITQIYFNGQSVQRLFAKHVLTKQTIRSDIQMQVLPSTSPANARYSVQQKLQYWRAQIDRNVID